MIHPESLFLNGAVHLTQSQVHIVQYLCEHPDEAIFMTAAQLGRKLGVSDATVVRLAQTLGFEGFSELKRHLRGRFMSELDSVARLEQTTGHIASIGDVLPFIMQADQKNLALTVEAVPPESFIAAVEVLKGADEVFVVGLRQSHAVAVFLASALRYLGRKVHLLSPGTGEIWSEATLFRPESVLVAISFPRYARLTVEVTRLARESGATIIALTDSILSPLAGLADHVLPARFRIDSFVESYVAPLSVVNALVTGVASLDGQRTLRRLHRMEQLWEKHDVYHKGEVDVVLRGPVNGLAQGGARPPDGEDGDGE